jgi:hypothetical protein
MSFSSFVLVAAMINVILTGYHINARSVCTRDPLDITFVLDSSASISKDDFEKKLQPAVKTLIKLIIPGLSDSLRKSRVACVVFGSAANVSWSFDRYQTKYELYNAVNNLNYEGINNTAMGDALHLVLTKLHPLVQPNVKHIIIMITDEIQISGEQNWRVEVEKMKASGISIFVIDLGTSNDKPFLDSVSSGRNYRSHISHYIDLLTQIEQVARLECITGVSTCINYGGHHFVSWDKRWSRYYGSCSYILARDNCKDGIPQGEPTFSVSLYNRHHANSKVTWPKDVFLRISNTTIILRQPYGVVVNGRSISLPYLPLRESYTMQLFGMEVKISFKNGMIIEWDGRHRVSVTLTQYMKNTVCGLCGNYNGSPHDDLVIGPACEKNGTQTIDDSVFGDSWKVDNPKDTEPICKPTCKERISEPQCDATIANEAKEQCVELNKKFAVCAEEMKNDPSMKMANIVRACEYDYCQKYPNTKSIVCQHASLLATICLSKYKTPISYMDSNFCPENCGRNMVFNKTGSPCQASCTQSAEELCFSNLTLSMEGCFCEAGYVMESGNCILPSQCGCKMTDGSYFKVGSNFTNDDCSQFCECQTANNNVSCHSVSCDVNAVCQETNGIRGCYCKEGYEGNGLNCTDINECEMDTCDVNAECVNTVGRFECTCRPGYTGSGQKGECYDIDECQLQNHTCDKNAACNNKMGNYSCTCRPGFAGSGQKGDCYGSQDYIGCYKDDLPRDLNGKVVIGVMTPEICRQKCADYRYYGLQYFAECYCGDTYGSYGIGKDSECNYACKGNENYRCGGALRNAVHRSQGYIGCYKDDYNRDLNDDYMEGDMNPFICRNFCAGYKYFGLQFERFCFCGNSYGRHGSTDDKNCNMKCKGHLNYLCGGDWKNAIHRVVI